MDGELMNYVRGNERPARYDRHVTAQARRVHDEVRITAFKADGAVALAGHIMDGVKGLHEHKKKLCQDDPALEMILNEVMGHGVGTALGLQENLYRGWRL